MKLILTGATGVAGLNIYRAALADPNVSHITLLTRRSLPSWANAHLPPSLASVAEQKTTTIIHSDFTSYSPDLVERLKDHDACIWALGVSSLGIKEPEYANIIYDYPVNFLKSFKEAEGRKDFTFVYFSGEHADPTQKSSQFWARQKGRAEVDLTALASNSPPKVNVHVLRPAYFRPPRENTEDWKHQRPSIFRYLDYVLWPISYYLGMAIPAETLSKVSLEVARNRWPGTGLFRNKMMLELGKEI